jgi:hypothetical protein
MDISDSEKLKVTEQTKSQASDVTPTTTTTTTTTTKTTTSSTTEVTDQSQKQSASPTEIQTHHDEDEDSWETKNEDELAQRAKEVSSQGIQHNTNVFFVIDFKKVFDLKLISSHAFSLNMFRIQTLSRHFNSSNTSEKTLFT